MTPKKQLEITLAEVLPGLIDKIKSGDVSSREEFAVLILPYVKIHIAKYANSVADSMESLAGLIVSIILSKINKVDTSKSIVGYIARSAINYCIDIHRKNKSRTKRLGKAESLGDLTKFYKNEPEISVDNLNFLLESHFSTSDAKILGLYYIDNLPFEEISVATGQPVSHIEETISLAESYILREA